MKRHRKGVTSRISLNSMSEQYNEKQQQKSKLIKASAEKYQTTLQSMTDVWTKNLDNLEASLLIMKEELLEQSDGAEISITGQRLICSAAKRAAKLTREASEHHKTLHDNLSKIGKNIDRHFEREPGSVFKLEVNMAKKSAIREQCSSMVFDLMITDGLNRTGESLKREAKLEKYRVDNPLVLKKIVSDLRQGEIGSSLDYIQTVHPPDESSLRNNLQTQMITDCIELDNYLRAVGQLRRCKGPWPDEREKAFRLVGALLIGRPSMCDRRYKDLFDFGNREQLALKMASFFFPNDAPLKMILRYGSQALTQLGEIGSAVMNGSYCLENELPMEISINPTHSAFTCPILKEQCNTNNPPMRLVCGHVISRDAINRLITSFRQVRSSARHARFKCPYCPREQYMDTAKRVEFNKWVEPEEEEEMDIVN